MMRCLTNGVITTVVAADHLRFTEESSAKFEMLVDQKLTSGRLWIGRLSRNVLTISGEGYPAHMIAVQTSRSRPVWWTVEESDPGSSLAMVAADFLASHRCVAHSGRITCASATAGGIWVRTLGNEIDPSFFNQALLQKAEALPVDFRTESFKRLPVVASLKTLYHDPANLGGPMPSFTLPDFHHVSGGWQAIIRREDGEAGVVLLNENFTVKSGRRIGKGK